MTTTAPAPTATCNRCGRTLRSAKSIAAGYGPTCKAKVANVIKHAAELTVRTQYKPAQITKATELVELAAIVRHTRSLFQAVSSRGDTVYVVDQAAHVCSCPAGQKRVPCYHLAAADILAAA